MFEITPLPSWEGSLLWLAGIALAAFAVSFVLTDVLHIRRAAYIGALALLTGALTLGWMVWSGAGSEMWSNRWLWGLLGAVGAGAFLEVALARVIPQAAHGTVGPATALWEDGVYGLAEGLLLSVLPVLVTWQVFAAVGWNTGGRAVAAAVASLLASVVVIVAHHLGYAEFRSRKMAMAVMGCGVLSTVYLLVGSPIAAMGGHVLLHAGLLRQGAVLPPNELAGTPRMRAPATPAAPSA